MDTGHTWRNAKDWQNRLDSLIAETVEYEEYAAALAAAAAGDTGDTE